MKAKMIKCPLFFRCGNSSVVERDLAMVDVASSTLVSRSIFLFILSVNLLFGANLGELTKEQIKKQIPTIKIQSLILNEPDSLPSGFNEYKLQSVDLQKINKNHGTIKAIYKTSTNSLKNIFVRFDIKAQIGVYVAKNEIPRNHELNLNDYFFKMVDISQYDPDMILSLQHGLITKVKIKKDDILKQRQFKIKNDVLKGDQVVLIVQDGGLNAQILATATQNGRIGDTINFKTENQNIKATLISKDKAVVR